MNDDHTLLRRYAESGDEAAFRALVERHLGLVYHAALRQIGGDAHRARDAAQTVFTDLARKASGLGRRPVVLAAWLHTATRHACARIRRAEHRRQLRETEAARMNPETSSRTAHDLPDHASADWERLRPVIDEALHSLSERDREAVLLRFFESRAYAEIGERLSISDDGARHRVERALEKLRVSLARRGVASTAGALGLALGAQAGLAPPAGLAASIGTAALASLAATGGVAAGGGVLFGASAKTALATAGAVLAALALGVGYAVTRPSAPRASSPAAAAIAPSVAASTLTVTDLLGADYLARMRDASAADFGRLLVELWQLGTPTARARFREVFDHWCLLDPEAASRWAVITRTGIGDEGGRGSDGGHSLRRQAVLAWAARDLDAAYEWTHTQPDLLRSTTGETHPFYNLRSNIIAHLAQTDPERALDLVRRSPTDITDINKRAVQSILQTWAKTDPVAALEALKNEPDLDHAGGDLDARMVGIWSKRDLDAATRWVLSTDVTPEMRQRLISGLAPAPEHTRATLDSILAWWDDRHATASPAEKPSLSGILRRWAETDAENALEFADALPDDLRNHTLFVAAIASLSYYGSGSEKTLAYDPVASLAFLALLPEDYVNPGNGETREKLTAQFLRLWAEIEPERVAIWAQQQLTTNAAQPEQSAALRALARQDLVAALTTLEKLPSDDRDALSISLAQAWAEKDPEAALKWIGTQSFPPEQTGELTQIIGSWMSKDPEAATAWVEADGRQAMLTAASYATQSIKLPEGLAYTVHLTPDSKLRMDLLNWRASEWLRTDQAAAMKFLAETPLLTPQEKTFLLGLAPKE